MTVHKINTHPVAARCGAAIPDTGHREVYRWQRTVNCVDCLAAD